MLLRSHRSTDPQTELMLSLSDLRNNWFVLMRILRHYSEGHGGLVCRPGFVCVVDNSGKDLSGACAPSMEAMGALDGGVAGANPDNAIITWEYSEGYDGACGATATCASVVADGHRCGDGPSGSSRVCAYGFR